MARKQSTSGYGEGYRRGGSVSTPADIYQRAQFGNLSQQEAAQVQKTFGKGRGGGGGDGGGGGMQPSGAVGSAPGVPIDKPQIDTQVNPWKYTGAPTPANYVPGMQAGGPVGQANSDPSVDWKLTAQYNKGVYPQDTGVDTRDNPAKYTPQTVLWYGKQTPGMQAGGPVQRPTHAVHNEDNQRMIAHFARRDPQHAKHLLQGLRREHNGFRAMANAALAHSYGLRSVGRHELAHGHDAHALHLLNMAHAKVPDGAEVNFTQHDDHGFNANVRRRGRESNFPLNRNQMMQFAGGLAGGFDHTIHNGVEKNLQILQRGRQRPRGYQEGGAVSPDPGYATPPPPPDPQTQAVQTVLADLYRDHGLGQQAQPGYGEQPVQQGSEPPPPTAEQGETSPPAGERRIARASTLDLGGIASTLGARLGDLLNPTTKNSANSAELDAARNTAANLAPTQAGRESYDPLRTVKEFFAPSKAPLKWGGASQMPPEAFEQPQPGREGTREGRDLGATPEAFEQPQPGREGGREFDQTPTLPVGPTQRFEEYGETKLTREERQNKARQDYLDQMQPKWEAKQKRIDDETERQIRKGMIEPGQPLRNPYDEEILRRFPLGGGSESSGIFHDTITKGMRDYATLDRKRDEWNRQHIWGVEEAPELTNRRGGGSFVAPLSRDPQARDVMPSDRYGRSATQQAAEGLRPWTRELPRPFTQLGAPENFRQFEPTPEQLQTRGPRMYTPQQERTPQQSWQPPPNIRGAVGPPPPADDMSPAAIAARAYPSAAQQPQRRDYEQKLREGLSADVLKREELASKERIAEIGGAARVSAADITAAARLKAADAKQVAEMSDKDFANAYERHIRTYQGLRAKAEGADEKAQIDAEFKPPPGWKDRYDAIMGGGRQAPPRTRAQETGSAETEEQQQPRQQQQQSQPPYPAPAGTRWFRNPKTGGWALVGQQ